MKKVCLIGSMRFYDEILSLAEEFHHEGYIVLVPFKDKSDTITDKQREIYDALIREIIDMVDEVFVVNVENYIGKSVTSEIKYAMQQGKPIRYLEDRIKIITICCSHKYKKEMEKIYLEETSKGNMVLLPAIFDFKIDELTCDDISIHHMLHNKKIDICDEVWVLDYDGYIGKDTQREVDYAKSNNKVIKYVIDHT